MKSKTAAPKAVRKKKLAPSWRAKSKRSRQAKSPRIARAKKARRAKVSAKRYPRKVPRQKLILAWKPTPEAQKVIDNCQDVFDNTPGAKSDCNKFVKAVCEKFGVNPFGMGDDADTITKDIRDSAWRVAHGWDGLDKDPVSAKQAADEGKLVIAGATGADLNQNHGHVVVVVSSEKLWKGFPYASWGTLGGVGKTNEKMTVAYKLADLPKVSYMSKKV